MIYLPTFEVTRAAVRGPLEDAAGSLLSSAAANSIANGVGGAVGSVASSAVRMSCLRLHGSCRTLCSLVVFPHDCTLLLLSSLHGCQILCCTPGSIAQGGKQRFAVWEYILCASEHIFTLVEFFLPYLRA